MSTKSTILLTGDNEHWYNDCSETLQRQPYKDVITLEFSKKNVRIDMNDEDDLVITIINPDCEIYKAIEYLKKCLSDRENVDNVKGNCTMCGNVMIVQSACGGYCDGCI